MELTPKLGEKKKDDSTIASEIGTAGVHIFVDRGFFERVDAIKAHLSEFMDDEDIKALGLSATRAWILMSAMKKLRFCWSNLAYAKMIEKPRVAKAFQAARRMIQRVQEAVFSDATDEEIRLICLERLSYLDVLVGYTFDSLNTTINKAFTVQGQSQMNRGMEGQMLDEDTANALMKLADQEWESKHKKQ